MTFPSGWYVVADARRVDSRPVGVRRFGKDLVLWRDGSRELRCASAACPHRGGDLSMGRIRGGCLQCPYHGFRFDSTGSCVAVPCQDPDDRVPSRLHLKMVPVRVEHDLVWMWEGGVEPTASLPWPEDLGPDDSVVTVTGTFGCHLTRYMENALDVHHFAFVHRRVLPFVGSRVDMEEVGLNHGVIHAEGWLRPSSGELLRRESAFSLTARFPTVVRLVTLGADLVAAACPVDEETTWVAGRYYRPRIGTGAVARATSWLGAQLDWQTAQRQDRRILAAVKPRVGSPLVNVGVGADRPIGLWYHQWHQLEADAAVGSTAGGVARGIRDA